MAKYLLTIMVETGRDDPDKNFIQDDITIKLVEQRDLDCLEYQVTHIFDLQELPADE